MGGGGGTVKAPKPSLEELNLQRMQYESAVNQQREYEMLAPLLYEKLGYKYEQQVNPEYAAYEAKRKALDARYAGGYQSDKTYQRHLAGLGEAPSKYLEGGIREMTDEEYYASLNESERAQYDINKKLAEREKMALEGTLPLDPTVVANLDKKEAALRNLLSSRVGAENIEESGAWQDWTEEKARIIQSLREGAIQGTEATLLSGQGAYQNAQGFASQAPMSIGGRYAGTVGLTNTALQPYQSYRNSVMQANQINAQRQGGSSGFGQLAGLGLVAAGTYFGGPMGGMAASRGYSGLSQGTLNSVWQYPGSANSAGLA